MAAQASVREQRRPGLRRNALGMVGIGVIGMAMMSPAIGFYGNWGYVHTSAGGASAFLFLIGGLIIAPTAVSYALVSRKLSSAGSAYTWAGHAISRHVGNWLGFIMIPFYCLVICGPAILFGLFFNAFLHDVGLDVALTQYWTFALGVVVMLLVTGGIAFSGITPSARVSLVMVVFETLVVLALGITIFVEKIHHLSGMPFDPSVQGFTQNAFWLAMPIAVFSYIGFDVISLTAEEAKVAKRSVPTATLAGVAFLGLFAVAMAYSFSFSGSEKQIGGWVNSGITPVIPIGHQFWGGGGALIAFVGMTAALGANIAAITAAGRLLYAMGRDDALPSRFARLSERFRTPEVTVLVVAFALAASLLVGWQIGELNAYIWIGTLDVFFGLVTYLFVNLGNAMLYGLHDRREFSWWWNFVTPVAGIVFTGAIVYKSFLETYWKAGFGPTIGRSLFVAALAWCALGVAYAYLVRNRAKMPQVQVDTGEEDTPAALPLTVT